MDTISDIELKQMEDDLNWWTELERYIPEWKVFGFSYRFSASIDTGNGQTLQLTGLQKIAIMNALEKEYVAGRE